MCAERLDEQEWQVLYILEARFPGFTREVRHQYWELEDCKRPRLTPFEIASRIRRACDPDLSDKSLLPSRSDDNGAVREDTGTEQVKNWLQQVMSYQEALEGLGKGDLYERFKDALLNHVFPAASATQTRATENRRASLLRYAIWSEDEAAEFLLHGCPTDHLEERSEAIKSALSSEQIAHPHTPDALLEWAEEKGWKYGAAKSEVRKISQEVIFALEPKRLRSLYLIILATAIDAFEHRRNESPAIERIVGAGDRNGITIHKQTVRKVLYDIERYFEDANSELLKLAFEE